MNSKEDFLNNDLFRKWVNSNDEEVNNYWQQWMKDNPDLANSAKENRELFRAMRFEEFVYLAPYVACGIGCTNLPVNGYMYALLML